MGFQLCVGGNCEREAIDPDGPRLADGNDLDENNFAWDFGGGAMVFFSQHFGVRLDLRYIRAFDDLDVSELEDVIDIGDIQRPGKLDFTRFTTGLILRF